MSAQELYITGLLESFSTFCEQNGIPSVVFQEAQLGLVSLLKSVQTKNWHLNDTGKFLLEFDKNTQVSPAAKALVIQFVKDYPPLQTAVFLRQYLLALTNNGCSLSTVKNYRSDINQFFVFCKNNDLELIFVKPKALSFLRKEQTDNASSATLKRKLSSLTQFGNWLTDIGFFKPGQIKWLIDLNRNPNFEKEISESKIATITQNTPDHPGEASRLLSLTRLLPRMRSGTHASSRAPLQAGLQGFSAGLSRAASGLSSYTSPKHQEHNHQLRTSLQELQSKLNKRTNQWLFSYINVAFIALFAIGLSYFGYMQFFVQPPATQAFPTSLTRPNRTLSFQGRLTDTAQNPVTAATNFRFRLYDSGPSTVGGTSLWDSGTCSVTPDQDGIFSTGLGTDCGAEIDSSVFSENANVWLQVEVAGETLSPRQSIKSVAYALNSETLQGYPPADPATANTVLVMNSSGEVSLGTSAPKIKASTGTLTLEGTTVTLQTTSNGNIALSPNGTGNVIASRYFSAPGATFSATYAGGTALVTRGGPSGTANIQEWQNNGGSALSIVNSAGNFGIGTTTTRAALDVNGDASTSGSLVFRGSSPATLDVLNGSRFDFQNSPGGDAGLTARLSILLNGNVGIGTTNPSGKLQITGDEVRIGSAGTINFATGDGDMYVQDYLEVDGTINGTSILQNGNTVCDASGNCTNSGLWQNSANAFHPRNEWAGVADLLLGGTSTASAKFGFINVASGTPTATISGNLSIVTPTGSAPSTTYNVLNGGSFNLRTSVGGDADLTSRLFVSNSGNVGLGSSSPTQSLDVFGDLRLRGNDITDSSDTTRLSVGATTTLTNTTTVLSGTATLTASSLATMTTSSSVNWGGATSLTFTADNASIYGSDSANGDLTFEGTSSGTKTSSYVLLQPNGGNVGIGSATPSMALDVQGDTAAHFQARFRNPTNGIGNITAGTYSALGETYSNRSTLVGNNVYADTVNTVGDQLLYRNTHASYGHAALLMSGGDIKFYNKTESVTAGAVVTKNLTMIIDGDNGNVGLGDPSPTQKLHVAGSLRVTGAYYDSSNSAGTTGYLMLSTGTGTAWTNPDSLNDLGWWDNTANVLHPRGGLGGVADFALGGTSTASAKFAIINMATGTPTATMSGNLSLITPTGAAPATTYNVLNGGTFNLRTSVGGDADLTSRIFVANAGNVGVGTTSPTQKLDVNGDLRVRGNDITDSGDATRITLGATTTLTNTTTTLSGTSTLTASSLATMTTSTDVDWGGIDNLVFTGDNTTVYGSDSSGGDLTLEGTSNGTKTASYVLLQPNGGNVGIGTTAAGSALLQVFGAADQLRLAYDISNYTQFSGKSNGDMHMDPTGELYLNGTYTASNSFIVGSTGALTLNSAADSSFTGAGNVGVGTASSISQKLHVQGNLRVTGAYYDSSNSAGSDNYILTSTGVGTQTAWTNPEAILDSGWWDNSLNVIHPRGAFASIADLVIGGNSTASADFQVIGSGTNAGYVYGNKYFAQNGTAAAPAFSFTNDPNTGFYNVSADLVGFTANGSDRWMTGSSSLYGTSGGSALTGSFHINLDAGAVGTPTYSFGGDTNLGLYRFAADQINIVTAGADRMTVDAAGNVGIGLTTTAAKLDIDTGANTTGLRLRGTAETTEISDIFVGAGGQLTLSQANTGAASGYVEIDPEDDQYGLVLRDSNTGTTQYANMYMNYAATDYLNIVVNNTNASAGLVVQSGGNVGIGTTVPGAMLAVGATSNFQVTSAGNINKIGNVAHAISDVSGNLTINANSTAHILMQTNGGNVGIGTTSSITDKLDVNGTLRVRTLGAAQATNVCISATGVVSSCSGAFVDGTGTANYLARWTDTDTIGIGVTYDNGTNVGIGTTTVTQKLDVAGNIRATGGFVKSTIGTGGGGAYIQGIVDTNTSFARTSFAHNAYWDAGTDLWNAEAVGANDMQAIMVPNNGGFQFITHSSTGNTARTMSHAAFTAGTKMTIEMGGNVGIGTTVPDSNLHVFGATAGTVSSYAGTTLTTESSGVNYLTLLSPDAFERGIFFGEASSNVAGGIVYNNPGTLDGFQFRTNGNNIRMVVDAAGNVGIGITTTANSKLQVYEGTSLGSTLGNSQILAAIGGSGSNAIYEKTWLYRDAAGSNWLTARIHNGISVDSSYGTPGTDTRTWWERDPNNDIQSWGTATTAYMTVNAGNVGIGVTSPANVFNVVKPAASNWQGRFQNNSGSGADVYLAHGSGYGMHIRGWNATDGIYTLQMYNNTVETNSFYNSGRATLALPSGANVGIGTSTPSQKLEVYGSLALSGQAWAQYSGGRFNVGDLAAGDGLVTEMRFKTSDTDRMSLTAGLEVGSLGFATPHGSLFTGQVGSSYTPTSGNWSSSGSTVLLSALDYSTIGFHDSGSRVDYIRVGLGVINLGYNAGWGAAHTQFGDNDLFVRTDDSGSNPGMPYMRSNGSYLVINPNASNLYLSWDSGTTNTIYFQNSNNYITNGGTWAMSGNLGIGTTVPIRKVHINGNTSDVTLRVDTTNADPNLTFTTLTQKDWSLGVDYSDSGKFKIDDTTTVGGSTRMTIDTAGNVGINTASPLAKLDILASLGAPAIKTANQTAGSTSEVVMNHTWNGDGNWDLRLEQQHVSGSHLQYNWVNEWAGTGYNVLTFYAANVGIGTTTPTRQNHIYGAAQATGSITDAGNKGGTLYLQDSGGSVGNGGTLLLGAGQGYFASIKGYITDGASNTTGNLTFATRAAATDTNLTERMILDPAGNLSIYGLVLRQTGDITDWANIEVNETNVGIGKNNDAGQFFIDDNGSASLTNRTTSQNTILSVVSYENPNPSLGIRQAELALDGQYSAGLGVASTAIKNIPTGNADGTLTFWTRYFTGREALTERMRISANGYVGIGLTPAYKLDLTGTGYGGSQDINVTGCYRDTGINVAGTCASDIRLKHSIATINDPLDIISQLKPSSYEFYDPIYGRGRQFGLIAQEVEQVKPEWVETDPTSGIKAVQYGQNLVMYSLAGVKELNTRFEEIKLDSEGEVILAGSAGNYTVTAVGSGNPINKMLAAAQVITGKVKTGLVSTQELVVTQSASIASLSVTNMTVAGQNIREYIAGIVREQVNSTSPQIATGSAQIANLTSEELTTDNLTATDASISGSLSTDIAMIDELSATNITSTGTTSLGVLMAQTATISGKLTAENLEVAGSTRLAILEAQQATVGDIRAQTADLMNATISGTLYAENIYDLNGKIAAALQEPSIMDIITNNLPEPLPEADPVSVYDSVESAGYTINPDMLAITGSEISFADGDVLLTAQAAYVEKYLQVNGLAYIAQSLGVGEDIILGTTTTISDRSLAFTPTTAEDSIFYFQPSGLGKLDFLAGTMTIESGAVAINGSLNVAGTTKTETLLTNLIQPADFGNPFQVQVAGASSQSGEIKKSRFEIINELGTPVATISAEGKANFAGGIGIGSETLNPADVASGSSATVSTNKTSGKARLQAGVTQITIEAEQITEGSLVYVTPVGSTQNQVLYVKSQTAENPETSDKEGKFVVGFDQAIGSDVNFNWWVVN